MVYYVVYKASKNYSNRSLIPNRLRAMGCRQINRGFWEVNRERISEVLKVLQRNQPIVLKRTRGVRKRHIANGRVQDIGSLILVSFNVPKSERERLRRLVKAAPCIRLCRGVYAFYQRQSKLDRENGLASVDKLINFVRDMGGSVRVFPKLTVVGEGSTQRLIEEAKRQMENEIKEITQGRSELNAKLLSKQYSREYFLYHLSRIKRQYAILNRKAKYFSRWLAIDTSKSLMKAYRSLIKVRCTIRMYFT